jgi:thioredoxin-dependent peroxiredoxin
MLKPGDTIPDVTLDGPDGKPVRVRDLTSARALVLYFYPKDETTGCTAEACSFRDAYQDFTDAGADVVGVSGDGRDSHARFVERHKLPFTLLSDPRGEARAAFGVKPSLLGLIPGRVTFVIDRENKVRHAFDSQLRATAHVTEALGAVKAIQRG